MLNLFNNYIGIKKISTNKKTFESLPLKIAKSKKASLNVNPTVKQHTKNTKKLLASNFLFTNIKIIKNSI